ncbi:MAG TPA: signal recognition particle-docking protein FtsY [Gemmatimonadales bacterium]|nr:signal recognition particle-docking protein FtsY [Gemmatimonadales bacterium]
MAPALGSALVSLWQRLARVLGRRGAGDVKAAERLLLEADFGVAATAAILAEVAQTPDQEFHAALERAVVRILAAPGPTTLAHADRPPTVVLVFGVNGVGKTTTVAKLARLLEGAGRSTLLGAADTFRAGAVEQLEIWAKRLGVPCVVPGSGQGDPAAVTFDAITAARARGVDTVLIDTAGRLHTDAQLLQELVKVVRVSAKVYGAPAPHEALLVLDGTTGQNVVAQGRTFAAALPLTGLVVTKLDGTAKGGSVVALRRALAVPVRFLATGEGLDDLEAFDPTRYARRLLGP